jgi:ABC-type spermidine/putrescine transport system permease subunit II
MCGLAIVGFAFLATPILMVFPLSVDPSPTLRVPPSGFSLRWYEAYFSSEPWMSSTVLSVQVAAGASCVASVVGTLAAIGLIRGGFPGRRALGMLLISPLLLPTVVVAIAIYRVYAAMRLVGTPLGLIFCT